MMTTDVKQPFVDSTAAKEVNLKKLIIRDEILRGIERRVLQKGFFGKATVEVEVADGLIIEVTDTVTKRHR